MWRMILGWLQPGQAAADLDLDAHRPAELSASPSRCPRMPRTGHSARRRVLRQIAAVYSSVVAEGHGHRSAPGRLARGRRHARHRRVLHLETHLLRRHAGRQPYRRAPTAISKRRWAWPVAWPRWANRNTARRPQKLNDLVFFNSNSAKARAPIRKALPTACSAGTRNSEGYWGDDNARATAERDCRRGHAQVGPLGRADRPHASWPISAPPAARASARRCIDERRLAEERLATLLQPRPRRLLPAHAGLALVYLPVALRQDEIRAAAGAGADRHRA